MDTLWHFAEVDGDGVPRLRFGDNREIRVGETLTVDCTPVVCKAGLHASPRLLDALGYAPERCALTVVTLGGTVVQGTGSNADKVSATERTVVAMLPGPETDALLREFARWSALSVANLWDMPDVVRQYLETGDETIRDAAWAAAGAAARDAAWAAAGDAARTAAWDAAGDAARTAAWDAAWAAAGAAARDAARDAAWAAAGAAARDAARDAAWAAAWDAAWAAAGDAAWAAAGAAAGDAARTAAWDAAWAAAGAAARDAARDAAWAAARDAAGAAARDAQNEQLENIARERLQVAA